MVAKTNNKILDENNGIVGNIEDTSIIFDIYYKECELGIDIIRRTIYFSGGIDTNTLEYIMKRINILLNYNYHDITIIINSQGGDLYDAFGTIDFMESIKEKVKINIFSYAKVMSGGAFILCSATGKRCLSKRSTIMLHGLSMEQPLSKLNDAMNDLKHANKLQQHIVNLLANHSNKTHSFWRRKLKSDFILTAEDALKYELIDEII